MLGGGKCSSPWGAYFDDYRRRNGSHAHPPGAARPGVMLQASVRVQIIAPPNALYRAGQIQFVREVTDVTVKHTRDPPKMREHGLCCLRRLKAAGVLRAPPTVRKNS